ncbi:MAG: bifunctional diaminohydroxyphosphoribosylaminopyrimidine deaminase/5-amino-6-(5-phosphoribosylamino)uracil reductase RibD [Gammaproteobacteria bacterium]|nr:bifunctional diaminohydroxyphosphoribosylaminopyrimidine deaminase/5-amino-6-(5-phosphoribosylamino)uracil reductase RibD [Gammaproteobacteria bacterium]
MGFSAEDHAFMAEALRLAEQGLYTTDPNPRVGCVLVKGGRIIARGFHRKAGAAHAEVNAVQAAGEQARGADVYVSLEPCAHFGRTPPCVDALIGAGVARVIAAMQDPNPQVAGRGFEKLRVAGIPTAAGLLEAQARALNLGFISRMTRGRPLVRSKLAVSLDGRTALAAGESRWITGEAARQDVQHWRARSSAILTGIGTVLSDDPSLSVRPEGDWRQPLRVIADSRLRTPGTAKLFKTSGQVHLATLESHEARHRPATPPGATLMPLPGSDGRIDLATLLRRLAELECNEVLVEAGATLNGALLRANLVDEILIYMAPQLLGDTARGMFSLPPLGSMAQRLELQLTDVRMVGCDLRILAVPQMGRS